MTSNSFPKKHFQHWLALALTLIAGAQMGFVSKAQSHEHNSAPTQTKPVTTEPLTKIKITLGEFKFTVEGAANPNDPLVLEAGKRYKLVFENTGTVMHEVLFGRTIIKGNDDTEYQEEMLTSQETIITGSSIINGEKKIFEVLTTGFKELELDPGLRLSLIFTVPETARGTWELGCLVPGHHESGMHIPMIVK